METSEKRRRKLLEQTRALYSDKGKIPAVHPRYGAAYHRYTSRRKRPCRRVPLAYGCFFAAFYLPFLVSLDRQGQEVMDVSSDQIQEAVTQDTDLAEVLGNYL